MGELSQPRKSGEMLRWVPAVTSFARTSEASDWSCRWSTDEHAESSLIDGRGGNAGDNTVSGAALPLSLIAAE